VQSVLPEAYAEYDREADQRHDAGEGELAGDGERVRRADHTKGHVAHQVREQEEDECGKDPGQIFLALGADARVDHIIDEADQSLDRYLPAPGDQLALHSAEHEDPDRAKHDQRPQRAVGEHERIAAAIERAEDRLDRELMHRIDVAGRHSKSLILARRRCCRSSFLKFASRS